MASRKKPKPRFEVPDTIQSAPQSGWVYRSEPPPQSEPAPKKTESPASAPGLMEAGAETVALGIGAIGNIVLLALRVVALPFTLTMRLFR